MWAGFIGPGDGRRLQAALGPSSTVKIGPGYALGASPPGASLSAAVDGGLTATTGDIRSAGSAAIVDPDRQRVSLACDPFGFSGAFTAVRDGVRWFASDPRILRSLAGTPGAVDPEALHGYLCFSYVPVPKCIVPGVEALRPGDHITVDPAGEHRQNHAAWREHRPFLTDQRHAIDELRMLLSEAVQSRLGHDTHVGVFLSGGLDSSLIAALLARAGATVHLFTLDFGAPFNAELPYADRVAHHLKRPLHVVPAGPGAIRKALEPAVAALQQPFGDGVTVPLYLLGHAAAREVGVVFNGEGGDQLFGGWANKPMIAAELHAAAGYDRLAAYMATYHRFFGLEDRVYTPPARAAMGGIDAASWVRPVLEAEGFSTLLHRLRAANLWLKGAQNIAPRAAQLAHAHGLQMRAPFFDRALAEWSFSLPPEWLLNGACEKYILKRVAEPLLPADVVWRDKRGMGVPTAEWCLGPLRRHVSQWLEGRRIRQSGWLDPDYVRALRRGQDDAGEYRRRRLGERLWALLVLEMWIRAQDPPAAWPEIPRPAAARLPAEPTRPLGLFGRVRGPVGGAR